MLSNFYNKTDMNVMCELGVLIFISTNFTGEIFEIS